MASKLKSIENEFSYGLGKLLKSARINAGLSQSEIGEIMGVTFQQVQKYEVGINRLSLYKLKIWAEATKNPISYFCDDTPIENIENSKARLHFIKQFDILTKPAQAQILGIIKLMNGGGDE